MRSWIRGVYHSFPVQLVFLHFRKYQALLLFWGILFLTVNGHFMKTFGGDSLYLSPEYLGNVNSLSAAIVGAAIAMFIMSWNIATFILFSKHFRFLAATTNPFLKYCINNALIPVAFLLTYGWNVWFYQHDKGLLPASEILILFGGFVAGFVLIMALSFLYFFRADRFILKQMMPVIRDPGSYITHLSQVREVYHDLPLIKVTSYYESPFRLRPVRDVSHYTSEFVSSIFKRHHFAAIISVFVAFLFLIGVGFLMDSPFFQLPAAASITIFFAILLGVAGAITYFLQSWSIPYLLALMVLLNIFYKLDWIDPRNKAYGLNYENNADRPAYTSEGLRAVCSPQHVEADKQNMISILNKWKSRQAQDKPLLVIVNTSGGGHRSATFTMSVLGQLDSLTNGRIMPQTFLINGASGGMIGAAYFRELYREKLNGKPVNLRDTKYIDNVIGDLLNPMFTSFFTRDLIAPAQRFSVGNYQYVKDRGYAFEEQLNRNTGGILDHQLRDYVQDEKNARIPLIFYNSVITRDSRKMMISTQPISFMMRNTIDSTRIPEAEPDAVDFVRFFEKQDPYNLRILTALRMNATFPIVLPNVWLPSTPVIDVMDAGLRDNFGQETSLRFIAGLQDWIKENTSGVLLIQIRDRKAGGWEAPYLSENITDHATKPFLLLQHNWFKMMDYSQNDMLDYFTMQNGLPLYKVAFQYATDNEEDKASLNFHLTRREEKMVMASLQSKENQACFKKVRDLLQKTPVWIKAAGDGNSPSESQ